MFNLLGHTFSWKLFFKCFFLSFRKTRRRYYEVYLTEHIRMLLVARLPNLEINLDNLRSLKKKHQRVQVSFFLSIFFYYCGYAQKEGQCLLDHLILGLKLNHFKGFLKFYRGHFFNFWLTFPHYQKSLKLIRLNIE